MIDYTWSNVYVGYDKACVVELLGHSDSLYIILSSKKSDMTKYLLLFIFLLNSAFAQQNYYDFEGSMAVNFGPHTGVLDTLHVNPMSNNIDTSSFCGKYIRDTAMFDYIKLYPYKKLVDVTPYASTNTQAPKIKMKVFTSAPPGTIVDIQLGLKSIDNYPAGVHSEYRTVTTVKNQWEQLTFDYLQITPGGLVAPTDIDKIIILLHPNSSDRDTMYFDDITGPPLINVQGIETGDPLTFSLGQNSPNPATTETIINFNLIANGLVQIELYNSLGIKVKSVADNYYHSGKHSVKVVTNDLVNGIYYYVLKSNNKSIAKKMIVSR